MRPAAIIFLLLFSIVLAAQNSDTLYNESDLQTFVKIKSLSVTSGLNIDSIIQEVVITSGISIDRLQEIIKNGFNEKSEILTESEKKSLLLFQDAQTNYAKNKRARLMYLCKKENMSVEKYEFLHTKFIKSISFQQSLLPLFKLQQAER